MLMDLTTSERNVTAGSALTAELVDLQKFMFSDRCHLKVFRVKSSFSVHEGSFAMDNLHQSLQDVTFLVTAECLPEGGSQVLWGRFYYFRCLQMFSVFSRCTIYLHLLHYQFLRCWGFILQWSGSIQGRLM